MSQTQILKILKREMQWICTKKIAEDIRITMCATRKSLNQMYKYDEVLKKNIPNRTKKGGDQWRIKF